MALIEPFRGIRYNREKVGDLNHVMAPPYDIISERLQTQLYEKHANNVIRLELGRQTLEDTAESSSRYSRSARDMKQWLHDKVLIQDEQPAVYIYYMDYRTRGGEAKTLKGFISRTHLEDLGSGKVLPHENTLSGPKADRLRLMESCHANFSPIFSLYSNPGLEIIELLDARAESPALIDVSDMDDVRHRVWMITDANEIKKIQQVMADLPLFIADGHHRYETALNYRNAMRERTGRRDGQQPFDYVMMYFSNMEEPGLTIYPTHRLVHHLQGFNLEAYLDKVQTFFRIDTFPFIRKQAFYSALKERGADSHLFGLYSTQSDDLFLLTYKEESRIPEKLRERLAPVLQDLDVTILHTLLLEHLLGIGEKELKAQSHVTYVKEAEDALHAVNDQDAQLAFLLNGTRVDQLRDVSLQGEKMPQKSTYFYPKLLTGLVINSLK